MFIEELDIEYFTHGVSKNKRIAEAISVKFRKQVFQNGNF